MVEPVREEGSPFLIDSVILSRQAYFLYRDEHLDVHWMLLEAFNYS